MNDKVEQEKIAYEPHPVTPERKKELRSQGYKIIDARFDPNPKAKTKAAETGDAFDAVAAKAYLDGKDVKYAANIGDKKLKELFDKTKAAETGDQE